MPNSYFINPFCIRMSPQRTNDTSTPRFSERPSEMGAVCFLADSPCSAGANPSFIDAAQCSGRPPEQRWAMAPYRVDIFDHGGNVRYTADFKAEHDEHAKSHAKLMWGGSSIGAGYQVWRDGRLVHSERSQVASPGERIALPAAAKK